MITTVAIISCLFGAVGSAMAGQASGRTPVERAAPLGPARAPTAPPSTAQLPETQAAAYAAREETAPELQNWKGGASLSITLGTTALVVLAVIVVLIILL